MNLKDYEFAVKIISDVENLAIRYFNTIARPHQSSWVFDHVEYRSSRVAIFYNEYIGNSVFRCCTEVPIAKLIKIQ